MKKKLYSTSSSKLLKKNNETTEPKAKTVKKPKASLHLHTKQIIRNTQSHKNLKASNTVLVSNKFKSLIKDLISMEKIMESDRDSLSLRTDFTIEGLFRLFDKKNKKCVSELDFDLGLKDLGVSTSSDNIFLIYRHYDKNNDGILDLKDFYDIFMPKKSTYAGLILNRRPQCSISIETKLLLKQVLCDIIELEKKTECSRHDLKFSDLSLQNAFDYIEKSGSGGISVDEFRSLLVQSNIKPTKRDLIGIMNTFDNNRDGKIDYSEFVQGILPKTSNIY